MLCVLQRNTVDVKAVNMYVAVDVYTCKHFLFEKDHMFTNASLQIWHLLMFFLGVFSVGKIKEVQHVRARAGQKEKQR